MKILTLGLNNLGHCAPSLPPPPKDCDFLFLCRRVPVWHIAGQQRNPRTLEKWRSNVTACIRLLLTRSTRSVIYSWAPCPPYWKTQKPTLLPLLLQLQARRTLLYKARLCKWTSFANRLGGLCSELGATQHAVSQPQRYTCTGMLYERHLLQSTQGFHIAF